MSGNSLTPGDYPVGVAFPPPNWPARPAGAVFHLVNLPTPRRQIAYSYYVKTDPAARLAKLSRRTLDRFLAEKKLLSDAELGMLGQLDAREVSRFASRYFLVVEDGMVEEDFDQESSTSRSHLGSQSSRFGAICAQLAVERNARSRPGALGGHAAEEIQVAHAVGPLSPAMAGGLFDRPPRSVARRRCLAGRKHRQPGNAAHRSRRGRGNRRHGGRAAACPPRANDPRRLDFKRRSIRNLPN